MNFFRKQSVARAVMIAAIILGVLLGQARKPADTGEPSTAVVGTYTYAMDHAGVLSDKTMEYIDAMNTSLFAQTGAQLLVVTVDNTGTMSTEEYAWDLGNRYQVGDEHLDNGIVLLLALENIAQNGLVGDYWVVTGDGLAGQDYELIYSLAEMYGEGRLTHMHLLDAAAVTITWRPLVLRSERVVIPLQLAEDRRVFLTLPQVEKEWLGLTPLIANYNQHTLVVYLY